MTNKLEFFFKSLTLLIKAFRSLYFPCFCAARIPCFCQSFRVIFSNLTMLKRIVEISLLVAKFIEFDKPKATKVIFFFEKYILLF